MRIGLKYIDSLYYFMDDENIIPSILLFDKVVVIHGPWESTESYNKLLKNPQKTIFKKKKIDELENAGLIESITSKDEEGSDFVKLYNENQLKINYGSHDKIKVLTEEVKLIQDAMSRMKEFNALVNKLHDEKEIEQQPVTLGQLLWQERLLNDALNREKAYVRNLSDVSQWIPLIRHYETVKSSQNSYDKCISVVLQNIPTISTDVTITQLKEFKADNDAKNKFMALRNFIVSLSKEPLSTIEINERLNYLLNEYEFQLNLHKSKLERSSLQTFVVATAEILENLATLKFSSAMKSIFHFSNADIKLQEAELGFTGREIAYIHKIKTKLGT